MEEKIKSPTTEEATLSLVDKKPLEIFKTKADLTGRDITQMSNFFDGYIEQMSLALREESAIEVLSEIPISDLSIVNEVVQTARVLLKDNVTLVPDFDNLPLDIKKKLKLGLYTISESKQVEGNMRAVILDENGTRVKDITLKKVVGSPENLETARNIGNQLQVKQIYAKLAAIEEFQTYQGNYPYTSENMDLWYLLKKEIAPTLKASIENIMLDTYPSECHEIYIVSMEDASNEEE